MAVDIRYPEVERRQGLSIREFNREYRCKRPVVLTDAINDWKASSSWTFDFFKTRYGNSPVRVHQYEGGPKYQPNKVKQMPLAEYIDGILASDWTEFPYYIRDNWGLLVAHPELAADYKFPKYFFDWYSVLPPFMRLPYPRIFIGPKGAVTPLHQDQWGTHAWLSQLVGRKRWIFFPPDQRNLVYDFAVHPLAPDYNRFPEFRKATGLECTIGPGDTVFVPSGWIHYVVSLDPTISLSSNYMGPGCFRPALSNTVRELVLKRVWNASTQWMTRSQRPHAA